MSILTHSEDDLCLNLLITPKCNAGCPFCIADEYMSQKSCGAIEEKEVEFILERLGKEKVNQVNILGGEPSLHPQAMEISKRFYGTGNPVGFSTNGLWNERFRKSFESSDIPLDIEVTYLGRDAYSGEKQDALNKTFKHLEGHSVSLGIIIDSPQKDYLEHIDLAKKHGFEIRWALLEPTAKLGLTQGYQEIAYLKSQGELASKMVEEANSEGIETWADLSVPRCAIPDDYLGLFEKEENDIQFRCPPFYDIAPNLDIWRCLPLASKKTPNLRDYVSFRAAYGYLNKIREAYSQIGVYGGCKSCEYLGKSCEGGPTIAKVLKHEI
jgi:MoaA/NifB/PqqE/SkfB family radical SAM enzyme